MVKLWVKGDGKASQKLPFPCAVVRRAKLKETRFADLSSRRIGTAVAARRLLRCASCGPVNFAAKLVCGLAARRA
jgi:hypothetical protein